jgi:alanine racemase
MYKDKKYSLNKLVVDCAAIARNYRMIQDYVGHNVNCAVVMKSDAYGLGCVPIMQSLSKAGCNQFFVRTIEEAIILRSYSLTDEIYVLGGISEGEESDFANSYIIPILNTKEQFEIFNSYCNRKGRRFEAVLNIDTGSGYTGIPISTALFLAKEGFFEQKLKIRFLMSDLACGKTQDSERNKEQLLLIKELKQIMNLPIALATGSSIHLGPEYYFDFIRISTMIFGETATVPFKLEPAISLTSKIIQLKQVEEDSFVGYDAVTKVAKGTVLATIAIGSGDGLLRSLSNKAIFYINGEPTPIVGNIATDLTVIDVTRVEKYFVHLGAEVEILGEYSSIKALADAAKTNSNEIISALCRSTKKTYINF